MIDDRRMTRQNRAIRAYWRTLTLLAGCEMLLAVLIRGFR